MATGSRPRGRVGQLKGRRAELGLLDGLIEAVRAGESRVLVVRGEPGVGKTALLDHLAVRASGCQVARAAGVQSEMELAFAGLHQLCAPMLNHLEAIPAPQRDAARIAFGLSAGSAPDRFLVALATLSLLSQVAGERPLFCVIDDEQWLDQASAQALGFVARRLAAEPVGLVFAARAPREELAGLPELAVKGLAEGDARALLDSVLTGPLDARIRDRIVAETRGNPLALLELPRGMAPAQLAGGFGLPGASPLSGRIEESFRRRIDALTAETRRLLQLAAADPLGEPLLVWQAARRLGIPVQAAMPAAEAGLVEFGAHVQFRHPLVRSAAYRSASRQDRQDVHNALAEVTDPRADPDRRAWHRAQAAPGPDEDVAGELERSAGRAQDRGGLAAAAAFLERAALLTPNPVRRTARLLAAARAKRDAGALDAALGLLVAVEAGSLDELRTAEVEHLRGQIALDQRRGTDAARLLLSAAKRLEPLDVSLARETHLEALWEAAMWSGDLDIPGGVRKAAEAARAAPPGPDPPRAADVLLDAFALRLTAGHAAAATALTRALLDAAVTGPLDERVRDRIVAETRGNPRALLEAARGLIPGDLAGGFGLPGSAAPPGRGEETFGRRLAPLTPATRLLLLVAAAEPIHDPVLVWRAAGQLGVKAEAAAPAAAAGLIESGGQIRFCHPLARSAVYRTAPPEERRRVHLALAEATDPEADPDHRAWHRAHAALGLDEDLAAELECSAERARARGGLAAAAAFRERAAELTPDPGRRAQRALAAAQAKHQAGAPEAARRLLGMAQAGSLDELGRAHAELLRAQMAADAGLGRGTPSLLEAAKRLEPLHPGLARETYRDAFGAALAAGRLAIFDGIPEVAAAALAAPPTPQPPHGPDLLLDGLAVLTTRGYAVGAPMLRRALNVWRDAEIPAAEGFRWLPLACRMSHDVWDDQSWSALTARLIGLARHAGALRVLPAALLSGLALQLLAGEAALAAAMAEEAEAVAQATGNPVGPYGPLLVAAWQGHEAETFQLIAATTEEMVARGEGRWLTAAAWATAVLNNGLGRYDEALAAAEQGTGYPNEMGLATRSMAELIEAAARARAPERAADAMARLSEITTASGTDWALGIQARSRALLSDGESAERLYLEAIRRLGHTRIRAELARAHLLYGEWLRRQNRRTNAREQLRVAYQMLTEMGFDGFAERARRELLATGETVRKRTLETASELTAQEAQIARLAGDGHTNTQIGGRLFISGRTVEWHLHKVFAKLGISSRKELREALPELGQLALLA